MERGQAAFAYTILALPIHSSGEISDEELLPDALWCSRKLAEIICGWGASVSTQDRDPGSNCCLQYETKFKSMFFASLTDSSFKACAEVSPW